MAHDTENPDRAGKDMDMTDTRRECSENGCTDPALPGRRKCDTHAKR
jgi:hypothetical protein